MARAMYVQVEEVLIAITIFISALIFVTFPAL